MLFFANYLLQSNLYYSGYYASDDKQHRNFGLPNIHRIVQITGRPYAYENALIIQISDIVSSIGPSSSLGGTVVGPSKLPSPVKATAK
jgi:hypothetical protein